MSNKTTYFLNTPLTLLLIILFILLMFCIMQHLFYKSQLKYDYDDDYNYNDYDYTNIKKKIQDNFANLTEEQLNYNINKLKSLIKKTVKYNEKDAPNIENIIQIIKTQRTKDRTDIIELLSNLYVLQNINNINGGNAVSYREFLKYKNPSQNIYYQQYL